MLTHTHRCTKAFLLSLITPMLTVNWTKEGVEGLNEQITDHVHS